ncbi:MAG: STAS/SEC14 domain-containing protein [Actinobacteria bacterium]|nr:STAS/SEC14 domain-containing protein [Actinomycetota bacterium]
MVEPIADLPAGTFGFRAHGELTRADYDERLIPPLREALAAGAVRLLVVVEEVERLDLGRVLGEARSDFSLGRALERTALVTDVGWIRAASHLCGRLLPGELRLFHRAEEDQARTWVAAP